jgi:hypothetical protein
MRYGRGFGVVVIFLLLAPGLLAYTNTASGDAYVRVVSANPDTRTYTLRCIDNPATGQIRDWFIRPDNGIDGDEPNIAEFLDRPASQDLTFTFPENAFYHIGCNIAYDNGVLLRGDLHLDLRTDTHSWNPQIVGVGGSGLTATWRCDTRSGALGSWQILDAKTHEIKSLGTSRELTYTVSHPGLFDVFCSADGNRVPLPTEFFSSGAPYFPNNQGVPISGTTTCTPTTEICNQKDDNCNGQVDENNVCSSGCYNSVQSIPPTCNGGSITTDSWNGCRTLICTASGSSMQVQACDKSGYFEMYKQVVSGSAVTQICIGSTCIGTNGYAKSSNYPICTGTSPPPTCTPTTEVCDGKDNNCNGQIDENNICAPPSSGACYSSVKGAPASCEGASISSDTYNGGRTVTCGATKIVAWDKIGFFEMYKQAGGNDIKICLGTTCIKDSGYAKSSSFPICSGSTTCTPTTEVCNQEDDNCNGQIDENNVCAPPSNSTCYNKVNDIPANCIGGTITTDDKQGCRTLVCQNGANNLQVMACNKPDGSPTYFEMYRQMQAGGGLNICIGNTCINDAGYVRSNSYPICS